jgi:hypothetical protein
MKLDGIDMKDLTAIIAISFLFLLVLTLIAASCDKDVDWRVRIISTIGCALSCSMIYVLFRWNLT